MPPLITQNQNKDGQKTNDRDLPQMRGRNCAVRKLREYGLPDCDGFVVTRDEVILCPECAAACKEGCDKMRAIGCGSCALFADEDDEGQGWCELHQESVCYADKCANRISKV